jgi:putative transposase
MDPEIAEKIGLLRHKIISPVLMDTGQSQMSYFKKLEEQEFYVPGKGMKRFKAATMKSWLTRYRKNGFKSIVPKKRGDKGRYRKISLEDQQRIMELREEYDNLPVTLFYERCLEEKVMTTRSVCYSTFVRFLKHKGLSKRRDAKARRRYEMDRFSELWVGDFCHTLWILEGKRKRRAILFAIIDDHSRYIVGWKFSLAENTLILEEVFKEAILAYGLPERLYVDNGSTFSSEYLSRSCANLGIGLVHSKPYDSPSRGKIERFFRTVRMRFLSQFEKREDLTLEKLNRTFSSWLRDDYHFRRHSSIETRPFDRYQKSIENYPPKRVSHEEAGEHFMVRVDRNVRNDATVSYEGVYYEVPPQYIGMRVELRHEQGEGARVYLYENDKRICEVRAVDSRANARAYRPTPRDNVISLHQGDEK